jgi:RNA polymerase sigma factor (sigma-70 family)
MLMNDPEGDGARFSEAESFKPRLAKHQQELVELAEMLSVDLDSLPRQSMMAYEWQRFSERIVAGDQSAIDELLMRQLRAIYGTAKIFDARLNSDEITIEDLFQSGVMRFYKCFGTFDPNKRPLNEHVKINTYAGMSEAASNRGLIFSWDQQQILDSYNKHHEAALYSLGATATEAEIEGYISDKTSMTARRITKTKESRPAAYECLVSDQEADQLPDLDTDVEEQVIDAYGVTALRQALSELNHDELRAIELTFGIRGEQPHSLGSVARIFGGTRMQVRKIIHHTLRKMETSDSIRHLADSDVI